MSGTEAQLGRIRASTVSDFYLFEMLAALRLRMTVRTARRLLAGLYAVALPIVLVVAAAGFSLIRPIAAQAGVRAEELPVALAVLLFYSTATYAVREGFSQRRFMVAGSPNAKLFRAMDISAREVFLVYCARRICAYHLLLCMVPVGFLIACWPIADSSTAQAVLAAVVPVGMCAVSLAVAARSALGLRRERSREATRALVTCVGSLALGISAALFIAAPLTESADVGIPALSSSSFATCCAAVVLVAGAAASFRLVQDIGRLPFRSFPLTAASLPRSRTPVTPGSTARTPPFAVILVRELRASAVYPLVKQVFLAGAGGAAAVTGFALASPFTLPMVDLPPHAYEAVAGAVAVMVLGLAEMLSRALGPSVLRAALRATWEAGMSSWSIARAVVLVWIGCGVCSGAVAAMVVLLLAGPGLAAIPVIMAVCGVSAALVAETLVSPPRNTDGSAASDPITAFLGLLLTGPMVWVFAQEWTAGPALAFCYASILTGVATACVRRSILKLH